MLKDLYYYLIIAKSGYFDSNYYLRTYPDIRKADINPLWHFIRIGWKEGRNPSSLFNTNYYLVSYNDVKIQRINPLIHYIKFGENEKRVISPPEPKRIPNNLVNNQNLLEINSISPIYNIDGDIAIHFHIYYADLIDEFSQYLENMPFSFDLFISVNNKDALDKSKIAFANIPTIRKLSIECVPNKGRDIAPFICLFGQKLKKYKYIAHFHTKKSLYNNGATDGWREYLCNSLLGTKDKIRRILNLLHDSQNVGLIYPQTFHRVPYKAHTWLANASLGFYWGPRLGIKKFPHGYFDFPVGTMFWARADALSPLFDAGITIDDFPEELSQSDGTLSHALERIIGLLPINNGMQHGIIMDADYPSWSAWRMDQYFNRTYTDLKNVLQSPKTKVIAFDLFDTLITRPLLNPESMKNIVASQLGGDLGKLYQQYRSLAENEARAIKGSDVHLAEIFQRFAIITGLSPEVTSQIQSLEESLEIEILKPREETVQLFRDAIATGKEIILVTDTFLSVNTITLILNKYGITGWSKLFVSNDVGYRKDSGELFKHIIDYYQIQPEEMLMIGDNERSDNQIPENMGIEILHILRPVEIARSLPRFSQLISEAENQQDLNSEISLGLVIRKNFSSISYSSFEPACLIKTIPYLIGYSVIGPLLVGFSQWLLEQSRQDQIDRLYFLSREGKIMKRVFDEWTGGLENSPASDYLELSRRATTVPGIHSIDDIIQIAEIDYFPNTIEKFLYTRFGLHLSAADWEVINKHTNISPNDIISITNKRIDHIIELLQFLEPEILEKSVNEHASIMQYLIEKGLQGENNKAVVDIGYGGTVQRKINQFMKEKTHGYYLMTDIRARKISEEFGVKILGCFANEIDPSIVRPLMHNFGFELEKLLSSNDPQVEYYEINTNNKVVGHYRELSKAEIQPSEIRNQIQKGALEYAKDARIIRETILPDFSPPINISKSLVEAFLTNQCKLESQLLENIILDDYYCGRDLV